MRLEANSQSLHKSITILCIYCICVCVLFSVASPPLLLVGIIRVSASLPRSSHATRRPAVGAASRLSNENTTHMGRVSKLCIYTIFYLGWVGVSSRTGHHHDHHRIPPHLYIYLYIYASTQRHATTRRRPQFFHIYVYTCINATPRHHTTRRHDALRIIKCILFIYLKRLRRPGDGLRQVPPRAGLPDPRHAHCTVRIRDSIWLVEWLID